MRYYSTIYKGTSEELKPVVKELLGYRQSSTVTGMNEYIAKNIENYMTFFLS